MNTMSTLPAVDDKIGNDVSSVKKIEKDDHVSVIQVDNSEVDLVDHNCDDDAASDNCRSAAEVLVQETINDEPVSIAEPNLIQLVGVSSDIQTLSFNNENEVVLKSVTENGSLCPTDSQEKCDHCPEVELAFIEKKPAIPGFEDDDKATTGDGAGFWQMVCGKSEEELAREAAEEQEWLKCIEEEEIRIQEEEKLKKILEDVAKNEAAPVDLEGIDSHSERETEDKAPPQPVILDPRFIIDPKKVPEGGIIEPEYREAMGFMEVPEKNDNKHRGSSDNEKTVSQKNTESFDGAGNEENRQPEEAVKDEVVGDELCEAIDVSNQPMDSSSSAPSLNAHSKSIEELEIELIEESRREASKNMPEAIVSSDINNPVTAMDESAEFCDPVQIDDNYSLKPIVVQENKIEDTIPVVYKIGVRKISGKIPAMKPRMNKSSDPEPAVEVAEVNAVDTLAEELERQAMMELLAEAKRGAEREKEIGPLGWQKSTVPPANKRFLVNTIRSALRDNRRVRRRRSRSRDRRRSRSNSRHRSGSESRSRRRRGRQQRSKSRSRSRDRRGTRSGSRDRRKTRKSRSRSRSRSRDSRDRRSDPANKTKIDSQKSHERKDNDSTEIHRQMSLVKPSKSSWSSDEDDMEVDSNVPETTTEANSKTGKSSDNGSDKCTVANGISELEMQGNDVVTGNYEEKTISKSSNKEPVNMTNEGADNSQTTKNLEENLVSLKRKSDYTPVEFLSKKSKVDSDNGGSNIEQVSNCEVRNVLSALDDIVEDSDPTSVAESKEEHSDSVARNTEQKEKENCADSSVDNASSELAISDVPETRGDLDEKTRKKFDILDSVLREIEENPEGLESYSESEQEDRKKSRSRDRKKHKKHKHKHKSKHKKHKRKKSR